MIPSASKRVEKCAGCPTERCATYIARSPHKKRFRRVGQSGDGIFTVIATHAVDEQMDGAVFAFRRIRGQFQHEVLYAHDLAVYFDARETLLEVAVQLLLKGAPLHAPATGRVR